MPICPKCGKQFRKTEVIDGVKRYLHNRKYCLECSPFGSRNTVKLELYESGDYGNIYLDRKEKMCPICGEKHTDCTTKCHKCEFKIRKEKRRKEIYGITGTQCWYCGYDNGEKGIPVLEFHHLYDKEFSLSSTEMTHYAIEKILKEMQKCALLCCRCHRELHHGMIDKNIIENIYHEKWDSILRTQQIGNLKISYQKEIIQNVCVKCGVNITYKSQTGLCQKCYGETTRKVERPSKEELEELIKTNSFLELGRKFGVSDNAIRKWAKLYDLPYRKKDL